MKNDIKNLLRYGNSLLSEEMKNRGFGFYVCTEDEYFTNLNIDDDSDFDVDENTCLYFMWADEIIQCWEDDQLQELTEQQLHEIVKNIIVEYDGVKNNKYLNFIPNGYCPVYY